MKMTFFGLAAITAAFLATAASPARAQTTSVYGSGYGANPYVQQGYNPVVAGANAATGAAINATVAAATPSATNAQAQGYAKMMDGQGARYGQKSQDDSGASAEAKTYHLAKDEAADPASGLKPPPPLYTNIAPRFYGDGPICLCVVRK